MNQTFPKGSALRQWYANVTSLSPFTVAAAPLGQLPLVATHADVGATASNEATA